MNDVTIVISKRTAARLAVLLDGLKQHLQMSSTEHETIDTLRAALTEGMDCQQLREKLAQENEREPIRRQMEVYQIMPGLYAITIRENRQSETSRHRLIARRFARTKTEAKQTAATLWQQFSDPKTRGEYDMEGEAAL